MLPVATQGRHVALFQIITDKSPPADTLSLLADQQLT